MDKPLIEPLDRQPAYDELTRRLNAGENPEKLIREAYDRGVADYSDLLINHLNENRGAIKQSIYDKVLFGSKESGETQGGSSLIAQIGTLVLVILALAFLINGFVDFLASRL